MFTKNVTREADTANYYRRPVTQLNMMSEKYGHDFEVSGDTLKIVKDASPAQKHNAINDRLENMIREGF